MSIKIVMKKVIKLIPKKTIQRQSYASISTNDYYCYKNDTDNIINIINDEFQLGFLKKYM